MVSGIGGRASDRDCSGNDLPHLLQVVQRLLRTLAVNAGFIRTHPIVVADVFAMFTGVSSVLTGELGDPEGASNIGALVPFFMMALMAEDLIIATPFIVRAAMGSRQACNRYLFSETSWAEYVALRARHF